jgi:ribonuclease HI
MTDIEEDREKLDKITAFSDGSCPRNGMPNARAAFAAIVIGGQFNTTIVRGEVQPFKYAFIDNDHPEYGIQPVKNNTIIPSNNRGELLGLIYTFLTLIHGNLSGSVEIWSDSQICIKTLLQWLPTRLIKGTERELKNYDLVEIAWKLLEKLRMQADKVIITHVRSHQKPPPKTSPDRFIWDGNNLADQQAGIACSDEIPNYKIHVISDLDILIS